MAGDLTGGTSDVSQSSIGDGGAMNSEPITATLVRPVTAREVAAVAFWTLAADLLIFRTAGLSGPALFFALTPILFLMGCPDLSRGPRWKLICVSIWLVAARLVWSGTGLTVFSGLALVVALAMSAAGYVPLVLEGVILACRATFDGAQRLALYRRPGGAHRSKGKTRFNGWLLSVSIPTVAAMVFGSIFVLANPNLFDWVSLQINRLSEQLQLWVEGVSVWELPFCVFALLFGTGLLRPVLPLLCVGPTEAVDRSRHDVVRAPLYAAMRNTLWTLIVLFAIYLSFEFVTLWKRGFPPGFYYAGYAHQGAAWLTFALALATALLSLAFSGVMLHDERLASLRRLSWIWSAQNLLLAAAVYNRLWIYVGYNGMTRMRTVGFFGTTLVVAGFCLVVYKIARDRGFWWLIRAQLIAFVVTVIVYSLFPVDYVAHRYNVAAVKAGHLHPSVMIAVKRKSDEGILPMLELTQCEDKVIRDGVLALLAQRQMEIRQMDSDHWTEFQGARELLRRRLAEQESEWSQFKRDSSRADAIKAFRDYAMQWY